MEPMDEREKIPNPSSSIPELLESYKAEHSRLMEHSRELERLRELVLGSAEREAATILTAARRDVRRVLMDARREVLVLVAQIQAVGCEAPRDEPGVLFPSEAVAARLPENAGGTALAETRSFPITHEIVTGARREVREVLMEARSELVALSGEARELRAHLSSIQAFDPERAAVRIALTAPAPADPSPEEPADEFPEELWPNVSAPVPPSAPPAAALPPRALFPSGRSRRSSRRGTWAAVAAALALAAISLFASWPGDAPDLAPAASITSPSGPQPVPEALPGDPAPASASTASGGQPSMPQPAAAGQQPLAAGPDPAGLSLALDIRRPVWLRTEVDGQPDAGRLYSVGERKTVRAAREVSLRAGDAGAVFVSVNGAPATPVGADGQVVTRRYGQRPAAVLAVPARPTPESAEPGRSGAQQPAPVAVPISPGTDSAGSGAPAIVSGVPTGIAPAVARDAPVPASIAGAPLDGLEGGPGAAPAAEAEIRRLADRWFDAYFARDRAGIAAVAAVNFSVDDGRRPGARVPAGTPHVERSMEQVRIDVAGSGAVLSARLVERIPGEQARQYVSLVSEVWIQRDGRWWLLAVRFAEPGTVASIAP